MRFFAKIIIVTSVDNNLVILVSRLHEKFGCGANYSILPIVQIPFRGWEIPLAGFQSG